MMDFNAIAERLGLENDEYLELLELFVDTSFADLENIESAIKAEDVDGTAKAAHSLKGSSGSLGLDAISESARKIEKNAKEGSLKGALESLGAIKDRIKAISASMPG